MAAFLTEDCSKYGSLEQFVLKHKILTFTAIQRLDIVIQLIECLVFLHYKSGPPKVHCDLHNPMQVNKACYHESHWLISLTVQIWRPKK